MRSENDPPNKGSSGLRVRTSVTLGLEHGRITNTHALDRTRAEDQPVPAMPPEGCSSSENLQGKAREQGDRVGRGMMQCFSL